MLINIILLTILEVIFSQNCIEGENNCAKCHPLTKKCVKCDKEIYIPNEEGICEPSKKCILGYNNCLECNIDENMCIRCDLGYYPDENGGCSYANNCEISFNGECLKCKKNFILVGKDYDLKYCKSLNSEDFKNCKKIDTDTGKCKQCIDNYNLNEGDKRCLEIFDCYESSFGICTKCNTSYYLNKLENKCRYQIGNFYNCKISLDGKICHECDDDYYLIDGYCVGIKYCLKEAIYNKCRKCFEGYYISNYDGSCTKESKCEVGDKKLGICTECEDGYYLDFADGKCKPNQENNEFKFCLQADIYCKKCLWGYYLSKDNRCTFTNNCEEVENGICIKCIEDFYLGLDKKCCNVEHCISSNSNFCFECEDNYYYDRYYSKCIYINEDNYKFQNCKSGRGFEHCEICKDDYYLNNTDYLCYDNTDIKNKFYKCAILDDKNEYCVECVNNYYLGEIDNKCTSNYGCDLSDDENEGRCLECNEYYCLDIKTGKCEYNDEINDENKKIYYRCNRTNEEGTECEQCLEGYDLTNGFCKNNKQCIEEKDGICQKCHNSYSYHFCLNNDFGCVQIFYDNCLECNDALDFNRCTKCYDRYVLNKFDKCVLKEED